MIRSSATITFIFITLLSVNLHASEPESELSGFETWEPAYSIPYVAPQSGQATITLYTPPTEADFTILGESKVDLRNICNFIWQYNPDFEKEIAEAYLIHSQAYGIRGDVAICQAIIETGWFKFADGTAVTIDQHNYCGLGVTKRGVKGAAFETITDGVRAHLQHLFAYASTKPLPPKEPLLDPRFSLVMRGVARTWHDLSNRWAMNPNYGKQISDLYNRLVLFSTTQ